MSKQFRLSLDETAKLLGSSNCSLGNSTLDKCLSSMRGGGHGKPTNSPTNHLKSCHPYGTYPSVHVWLSSA